MHTLRVRLPRPELRPYVRTFVQRNIGSTSSMVVEPKTAQLEQILAFDFGTPVEVCYPDGRRQVLDRAPALLRKLLPALLVFRLPWMPKSLLQTGRGSISRTASAITTKCTWFTTFPHSDTIPRRG